MPFKVAAQKVKLVVGGPAFGSRASSSLRRYEVGASSLVGAAACSAGAGLLGGRLFGDRLGGLRRVLSADQGPELRQRKNPEYGFNCARTSRSTTAAGNGIFGC